MVAEQGYEFLDHTADVIVHGWAPDEAALFTQLGLALMAWMVKGAPSTQSKHERPVVISSVDRESLLVDWLTRLLTFALTDRLIFTAADYHSFAGAALAADVRFREGNIEDEVKAVTYHGLSFSKRGELWEACVTLDL